jgi:DNA repair photolyase
MTHVKPGVPAPSLAPLMGRETIREKGGVVYRELRARNLLNHSISARMPFRWTVNPYRGCAMGCRYCYATYTHEFMGIETPEQFHSLVYVKKGHEAETAAQLATVVRRGELIAIGAATDPYQPGEAEQKVTRHFLEQVARHRGVRLGITTKGALILRDVELLQEIHRRSSLSIHVSLISPHADLIRKLDPWAPAPEVRIEVMRRLVEAGLEVWLGLAPVLPAITDGERDLDALLGRVAAAGVRRLFWNMLFLRSPTREKYLRWLAAEFPRLEEAYENAYRVRVYLRGAYRDRVGELIHTLEEKHGFLDREDEPREGAPAEQLALWPDPDDDDRAR